MRLHASEPHRHALPGRLTALVVDDSVVDRRHLARVCARLRISTRGAASVAEAEERLDAERYDVAVIDHRLGPDSGYDVAALLDRSDSAGAIRILLTGNDDPRIAAEAETFGFHHCLAKGRLDIAALARLVAPVAAAGPAR